MDQQFSLRWNNYPTQITDAFGFLRSEEDLIDVTLSCEGKRLKAHKMLLSACSVYFRDIFRENPCQHPVIVFRNVKFADLEAIVDFMYKGEVNVRQDHLESFLGTAELLEVKGLTDGPGKEAHLEEEARTGVNKQQLKTGSKQTSNRTIDTPRSQPPVSTSPLAKRRKYNTPLTQRKPVGQKEDQEVCESPTLPVVPKVEESEFIEDLTEYDDEEELDVPDPLQVLQRESKLSASEIDFNSSTDFSRDQNSSTTLTVGQIIGAEAGSSVDVVSQEAMQAEDDDHPMVEEMTLVEEVTLVQVEVEAQKMSSLENLCGVGDSPEIKIGDSEPNKKIDVASNKNNLENNTKCLSKDSTNEKSEDDNKPFSSPIQQPKLKKNLTKLTPMKHISNVKEEGYLARVYTLPKGLNVTISPVVISQVQDDDTPKNYEGVQGTQPTDEFITLRSEEAKTPVHEDLQAYQCLQGYQQTKPYDVISTSEPAIDTENEPEMAEKAPELESEQDTEHVEEEEEEEEEAPKQPEFDYYGCSTCKEDGKPVLDRFNFTHKCPICPCLCFCSHLLKEHMRMIHGWFNVQRRFQQY